MNLVPTHQNIRLAAENFLHFGYDPIPEKFPKLFTNRDQWDKANHRFQQNTFAQASKTGRKLFLNILERELELSEPSLHVLPLSGGYDSRLLLGGLLNFLSPTEIQAVTFGLPGTWDVELARLVVKQTGVHHQFIDLSKIDWEMSNLINIIRQSARMIPVFEAVVHQMVYDYFSQPLKLWSGFLGEISTGVFQQKRPINKEEAINIMATQQLACRNIRMTPDDYDPVLTLKEFNFLEDSLMGYDYQLQLGIRNNNYIYPVVVGSRPNYITPYTHTNWLHFFLNQPTDFVFEQRLMKQIGLDLTPELFSLPFKNNFGLPLNAGRLRRFPVLAKLALQKWFPSKIWGIRPFLNYFDYDDSLRSKEDIREIVGHSIADLARRNIIDWMDIKKLWQEHQRNPNSRYGRALILLASLELNLKIQYGI